MTGHRDIALEREPLSHSEPQGRARSRDRLVSVDAYGTADGRRHIVITVRLEGGACGSADVASYGHGDDESEAWARAEERLASASAAASSAYQRAEFGGAL